MQYKITKEYELVVEEKLGKVTHEFEAVQFINKIEGMLPDDYPKWFDSYPWWLKEYMDEAYLKCFSDSNFIMNWGTDVEEWDYDDYDEYGGHMTYNLELGNYISVCFATRMREYEGKTLPHVYCFEIHKDFDDMMDYFNKHSSTIRQPKGIIIDSFGEIAFKEVYSEIKKGVEDEKI